MGHAVLLYTRINYAIGWLAAEKSHTATTISRLSNYVVINVISSYELYDVDSDEFVIIITNIVLSFLHQYTLTFHGVVRTLKPRATSFLKLNCHNSLASFRGNWILIGLRMYKFFSQLLFPTSQGGCHYILCFQCLPSLITWHWEDGTARNGRWF